MQAEHRGTRGGGRAARERARPNAPLSFALRPLCRLSACVLITRPEPYASGTAHRLAARGFTPIIASLLHVRRRTPRLPAPTQLQAILVTSGNALPGLAPGLASVPLLAVGDATALRAQALGFSVTRSAHGDMHALAALAIGALDPRAGAILVAAGVGRGQELATEIRAAGFRVIRRILYQAMPVAELPSNATSALCMGSLRAALFFSGDTARTFVRLTEGAGLARRVGAIEALAIGERAASALRALPFRAVRVALRPTEEALLEMLE